MALGALCGSVLALMAAAAPAQAITVTYTHTGGEQTFVVPAGVFSIQVVAVGGSGGSSAAAGGAAAQVSGTLPVTPGQTLYVEVGGKGQDGVSGGAGGFNGGAAGGGGGTVHSGGGGGASDIRLLSGPSLSPDTRQIVAAGGGGGGGTGTEGSPGAGGAAGEAGASSSDFNEGGGPGTLLAGGGGGIGVLESGDEGQRGEGGEGGPSCTEGGGGGGGGAGYFGGGGGGPGCNSTSGGGGGGGSSLVPEGGSQALASLATPPQVQITYTPPSAPIGPTTSPPQPDTILGAHPKKVVKTKAKRAKVKFGFSSTVAGSTFQCKLDKGAFASCKSPKTYKVKPGKHKFSVKAVNGGVADPTPATFSFKVKKVE
jgi:hypothetical protein